MSGQWHRTQPTDREIAMAAAYKAGKTLAEIGLVHGVTRERVRQILSYRFKIKARDGGQSIRSKRLRIDRAVRKDQYALKRWGCTWAQYAMLREMFTPTRAFTQQRSNAARRGIGWELSLWQWWTIWQESGHWGQRGRGNNYMMCRKGDVGPYSPDNVFIERGIVNSSEGSKKSGLPLGVRLDKRCKNSRFIACRQIGGKKLYLGHHASPEAAHAAYLAADPMQVAA